ncbi:hypothetical protein J6590_020567 [Homalodisca vitripennis]|nr:hypothetical protein J6590_020567 [Homalodisca vitripennis]
MGTCIIQLGERLKFEMKDDEKANRVIWGHAEGTRISQRTCGGLGGGPVTIQEQPCGTNTEWVKKPQLLGLETAGFFILVFSPFDGPLTTASYDLQQKALAGFGDTCCKRSHVTLWRTGRIHRILNDIHKPRYLLSRDDSAATLRARRKGSTTRPVSVVVIDLRMNGGGGGGSDVCDLGFQLACPCSECHEGIGRGERRQDYRSPTAIRRGMFRYKGTYQIRENCSPTLIVDSKPASPPGAYRQFCCQTRPRRSTLSYPRKCQGHPWSRVSTVLIKDIPIDRYWWRGVCNPSGQTALGRLRWKTLSLNSGKCYRIYLTIGSTPLQFSLLLMQRLKFDTVIDLTPRESCSFEKIQKKFRHQRRQKYNCAPDKTMRVPLHIDYTILCSLRIYDVETLHRAAKLDNINCSDVKVTAVNTNLIPYGSNADYNASLGNGEVENVLLRKLPTAAHGNRGHRLIGKVQFEEVKRSDCIGNCYQLTFSSRLLIIITSGARPLSRLLNTR